MIVDTATNKEAPAEISSKRVQEIFPRIAQKYEQFNAVSSLGAYKHWLSGMMEQAPIKAGDNVLDLAGGTGDVTFAVAQTKHPAHIQCTDLVPEMLDVARVHAQNQSAGDVPVDFDVVDAQKIPYGNKTFDAVTMAYGIRNVPDRPRAFAEILRVLKPGGVFVCLDFSTPKNRLWRSLYHFYLDHFIPFWGRIITNEKDGFAYLVQSIRAFPDQKTLANMIKDAGFVNVTWKSYMGGIATVHVAFKPRLNSD